MQPFLLSHAYKDYLWGGEKLKTEYGRSTPLTPLAESWALSAHPDGESKAESGPLCGTGLAELFRSRRELFGSRCAGLSAFPVLVKLIDSALPLSVQVHPDDAYARPRGDNGKTELWVILKADEGAKLVYGFTHGISKQEYRRRIEEGSLEEVMRALPVKAGDVCFVPAGTLHAIGAGLVIAEIQQSSNLTYRVYDYGRSGAGGKPRPLHIGEALDVTRLTPANPAAPGAGKPQKGDGHSLTTLARCPYFTVRRLELEESYRETPDGGSFVSLLCTGGEALLSCAGGPGIPLRKGDSLLAPATLPGYSLAGKGSFLLTSV